MVIPRLPACLPPDLTMLPCDVDTHFYSNEKLTWGQDGRAHL